MEKFEIIEGGVCSAKGFRASGVAAGIKYKDRKDVALIVADAPCAAAAMFTTNTLAAAPVVLDRGIAKYGKAQAILANSGIANACTGADGLRDAVESVKATAAELHVDPRHVFVASTGVIGRRLPMKKLLAGMRDAAKCLEASPQAGLDAEYAVMTTDTKPKQAAVKLNILGHEVTIGGMCKGSGMIEPNMATMLGFITTDCSITPGMLRNALRSAVNKGFNRLVVDGDESTNDSVFILASGAAGNKEIRHPDSSFRAFRDALIQLVASLAKQMAADGEGATKFVTVKVTGAATERDAEAAARAIAKSPLCKTSWFGKDPNWGRVLAAVGASGAKIDENTVEVFYGKTWAYKKGKVADSAQLKKLEAELDGPEVTITVDLHFNATREAVIYTCDFSTEYVHINADYTT